MNRTTIAWTQYSWNPITGCTHAGTPECDNCYAKSMSKRLQGQGSPLYTNGFRPTFHEEVLAQIAKIPEKSMVFLPSMSDLFHKDFTDEQILSVLQICESRPDLVFQILTKRPERAADIFSGHHAADNIWVGVTCGHEDSLSRIDVLRQIEAPVRWISAEPLLSDLAPMLDLANIDWVVVGGESGPKARICKESWVWNLKEKCDAESVAFFFKQWGSVNPETGIRQAKTDNGCLLRGQEYKAYPTPRTKTIFED